MMEGINNNMRPLHIIMSMAGEGSRFLKEGWTTPKPLIKLHDKEFFLRAIGNVKVEDAPMKYSFIVRQEDIDKYQIDQKIKEIQPETSIFSVQTTTRGAVETCLMAREAIDAEDSIVVMDCDLEFKSKDYVDNIEKVLTEPIDKVDGGMLVSFDSNLPKYISAKVDEKMNVIRTAEKKVI